MENKLIDREGYIEDLRAEFDPKSKRKVFINLVRYRRHAIFTRERGRRTRIALVHASGPVVSGEAPATGEHISGVATASQIDRASRDERVKAIVFRVNSPGRPAVDPTWCGARCARRRDGASRWLSRWAMLRARRLPRRGGGRCDRRGTCDDHRLDRGRLREVQSRQSAQRAGRPFRFREKRAYQRRDVDGARDDRRRARATERNRRASLHGIHREGRGGPASQPRAGRSCRQGPHLERARGERARSRLTKLADSRPQWQSRAIVRTSPRIDDMSS